MRLFLRGGDKFGYHILGEVPRIGDNWKGEGWSKKRPQKIGYRLWTAPK